jgi:hypothetical protein
MALVYFMLESKKEHAVHQRTPFIEFKEFNTQTYEGNSVHSKNEKKMNSNKDKSKVFDQEIQSVLRTQVHAMHAAGASQELISSLSSQDGISAEHMMARNLELNKPMETIWRRIRANIHYHSDFYINNIQGIVRAEILVSKGGGLQALVSIDGPKELVEWVKTALHKSLNTDFLKIHMSKKALLNLFFRFVILPYQAPVQEFVFAQTQLNFDILGYKDFERGKISDVYNALNDTQVSRTSEWNFSTQLEPYKDSCLLRRNITGCEIAFEMLTKMGLHQDAIEMQQQINFLSNKNTLIESD